MKVIKLMSWKLRAAAGFAFVAAALTVGVPSSLAAVGYSETDIPASEHSGSFLGPVQLAPLAGFTAINSSAGFNIGAIGSYRPLLDMPLYFEPSFVLGFFDSATQFNFDMGARFDLPLATTKIRPYARAAIGPTFQTSGSAAVFNAQLALGVIMPVMEGMDVRAQGAFVNVDGNAGFQLLAGISL